MYIEINNVVLVFRSLGYIFLIVQNRGLTNSRLKVVTENGIMLSWMTVTSNLGVEVKYLKYLVKPWKANNPQK